MTDEVSCAASTVFTPSYLMRSPQLYYQISDCVQVWLGVMCSQLGGVADGWLGPRLYHPHHAAIITPALHFPHGGVLLLPRRHVAAFMEALPVLVLYWQSVVVSCSGLISIHVAMTDAGPAVFLCLLWCLLTGSREIVFRLIWKPGPISQGTLQWRSSSKATDTILIFENRWFRPNIDEDHYNSGCRMSILRRRTASEPEPDHIITSASVCFRGWILVLDQCSPHLGVIHNAASVIWPGI